MPHQPTHELVLRGRLGPHLLAPFRDDFTVTWDGAGTTRLSGTLRDAAHLHGLVAFLASINAELISVTTVVPNTDPRSTS